MSLREPTITWGPDVVTVTYYVTDEVLELVRWGMPVDEAKAYYQRVADWAGESVLRTLQSDCERWQP